MPVFYSSRGPWSGDFGTVGVDLGVNLMGFRFVGCEFEVINEAVM